MLHGEFNDSSTEFGIIPGFDIIIVSAEAGEVQMPDAVSKNTERTK